MFYFFLSIVFLLLPLQAVESPLQKGIDRVHSHVLINDHISAVNEAILLLQQYPEKQEAWKAYIFALSKSDNEKELYSVWKNYTDKFPKAIEDDESIESLAWNIIENGAQSTNPQTRLYALLASFFSQDAKGIAILHKQINDNNACVRGAAIKLASELHDAKLCDAIKNSFQKEKNPNVRIEVIKAMGSMKIKPAYQDLVAIVSDPKSTAEEKLAAIQAIVELLDTANSEEVQKLAASDRAGLRVIACKVIALYNLSDQLDLIYPLLFDSCSEVRAAAIAAFGSVGIKYYKGYQISELAAGLAKDRDPEVAITAAWVQIIHNPAAGQKALIKWLEHEQQEIRIFAAGALNACGKYGVPLAQLYFQKSADPYVRLNLALGLIGQRENIELACQALSQALMQNEERWAWQEKGIFRMLAPSKIAYDSMSLESPSAVNQLVRLDILNILAVLNYNRAAEALIGSLQQRIWGVSGMAAALLLTEGDEAALDLVRNLLNKSQGTVQIQAALILAMWGRDEQALNILQKAYSSSDRELKEYILEGFGRVGEKKSLPFLVERLQEPSQTLRIVAATAILQTLYH